MFLFSWERTWSVESHKWEVLRESPWRTWPGFTSGDVLEIPILGLTKTRLLKGDDVLCVS